jgi:hypothetical protein
LETQRAAVRIRLKQTLPLWMDSYQARHGAIDEATRTPECAKLCSRPRRLRLCRMWRGALHLQTRRNEEEKEEELRAAWSRAPSAKGGSRACRTPEFSFPLQLVYLTTRNQEGLFGSGWFCPQLESFILPVGKGVLLWSTPSGGQIALQQSPDRLSEYRSTDRLWKAEVSPSKQKVENEEGWEYHYSKGKLEGVVSPSRRMLEFEWQNGRLQGVQFRDIPSSSRRLVLVALYNDEKRLSSFKLDGQLHRFAYIKDGSVERLSAWQAPVGETAKFLYHPENGGLAKVGIGNTEDPRHRHHPSRWRGAEKLLLPFTRPEI